MKKRMIAILLMMVMILGTGTLYAAAEEAAEQAAPAVTTEAPAEETVDGGDITLNSEEAVTEEPAVAEPQPVPFTLTATAAADKTGDAVISITAAGDGSDAVSYYVVKALKNGRVDPSVPEVKTTTAEARVSGLNGVYAFQVEAFKEEVTTDTDPETGEEIILDTKTVKLGTTRTADIYVAAVQDFKVYPAYRSVALEWAPVEGAVSYQIFRNGDLRATVDANDPAARAYDNEEMMAYIDTGMNEQVSLQKYNYVVYAVNESGMLSGPSEKLISSAVQQMYVTLKFKAKCTLTSHDGSKKKYTFPKNATIYAHGYLLGKHQFYYTINGQKYLFYAKYTRLKNASANYTTAFNYETKSAEYFANTYICSDGSLSYASSTPYLIWVNRYTQHVYVLEGSKGNWRISTKGADSYRNKGSSGKNKGKYSDIYKGNHVGKVFNSWECSSGKASTPSPTGIYDIKRRKIKLHGHKWWNYYHSQTALHGWVKGTVWGTPKSSGCVRNPDVNAEFIYYNIPLHTKVVVY
jgi:hypothetical protein